MKNTVRFECTRLGNHLGKLSKDKDGYYTMPVGGLNVYNSSGEFYTYEEAKKLFENSSPFMRRVDRGALRAEVGHPVREPGMSEQDYVRRILTIRESNTCAFFKEIWLDFDSVKDRNGMPVIAIMAKVAPSGPHAQMLADAFERKGENVCFSIRAFTVDKMVNGVMRRTLDTIVTFDFVNEPGIDHAEKFRAPSLENERIETHTFSRAVIEDAVNGMRQSGVATESSVVMGRELLTSLGWQKPAESGRGWTNW